jgi:glycosyltransferase involved in cell wall biosynthesis
MSLPNPKIVEVIPTWPTEVFIQRHAQALMELGVSLGLVARSADPSYARRASIQQVEIPLPVSVTPSFDTFVHKCLRLIQYGFSRDVLHSNRRLRERLLLAFYRQTKADLIHFHNAQLAVSLIWICQDLDIPYTVSLRGADAQVIPLRSASNYRATQNALLGAAGIHTVCDHLGRSVVPTGKKYTTIYTPVHPAERLPDYPSESKEAINFISIGRMQWEKGFPDLLIALRSLLDAGIRARLSIIGGGNDRARMGYWLDRLRLKHFVTVIEKASTAQVREALSGAHAYIQASIVEGLSNATAEAMAWGCPVFATQVGGTAEVIQDGSSGFLLEPLHPEAWAEKLELAQHTSLMRTIRERAHQRAKELFSPQIHGERFLEFYRGAIARGIPVEVKSSVSDSINKSAQASPHTRDGSELLEEIGSHRPDEEWEPQEARIASSGSKLRRLTSTQMTYQRRQRIQEIDAQDKARLRQALTTALTIEDRILIWGPWEWQAGADQLIRALSDVDGPEKKSPIVVGRGPQEDELRYLMRAAGFEPSSMIELSETELQSPETKARWLAQADVVIEKCDGDNSAWQIRRGPT